MNTHLLEQARQLPLEDRLELVEALWDSIAEQNAIPLSTSQKDELDRRLTDLDANPEDTIPWDEAKVSVLKLIEE